MTCYMHICGGIGNQLFQIAAGYAYALRYKKEIKFSESWEGIKQERPSYWDSLFSSVKSHIVPESEFKGELYKEPIFCYTKIPEFKSDNILKGYFQSEKYFEEYKDEIRKFFQISPNRNNDGKFRVAIHIRRGDYLLVPGIHTILSKEYYVFAKKIIEYKLGFRPTYIYFSEDKEWVNTNFKDSFEGDDKIFMGKDEIEDFQEMMSCDAFILANSSFGWWASWFSGSEIVIAPRNWFGPQFQESWESIFRKHWILL